MNHWYLWVLFACAVIGAITGLMALGFLIGYNLRFLTEQLHKLTGRVDDLEAGEELAPGEAVVNTTPQIIEAKRRRGELPSNDSEESAIVTVKSPRQLAEERDAKIKADLDEIQGHSSRIGP